MANSLTGEYRRLWLDGSAPSVEQFLARQGNFSSLQLADLLILDQSLRWEADERTSTEQYFHRFPDLINHPESAIDLVFSEFLLHERAGLSPVISEYVERFPQYADELLRQDAFHRAIGDHERGPDFPAGPFPDEIPSATSTGLPEINGYQILGELGRGGIGVVYQARHVPLNRLVALKMLLAGNFASAGLLRRIEVEGQAIARLQHPGIVQIFEVGQHDGHPFLALEFINGGTLSQWTGGRPQPPSEAATMILSLACAVQYAHEKGVVHRDLKPANVLIQKISHGDSGALAASDSVEPCMSGFQLKIADFGLAKLVADDSTASPMAATMSGDILGTAAYMSPEQARGGAANLTAATDIYSLGAILYELLTGRSPFVGVQPLEVLGQVLVDEPVRPSQLVRRLPKDIQTICLKCLEKSPGRRYGSAGELADDLRRFLGGVPIVARHTSAVERCWRWCRRHPVKTSIAASLAAMLVLSTLFFGFYSYSLGHQLHLTTAAGKRETAARVDAVRQLWESRMAQADAIRSSNQFGQRYEALRAIDSACGLGELIRFNQEQTDRMLTSTIASLALPDARVVRQWEDSTAEHGERFTSDNRQATHAWRQSDNRIVVCRPTEGGKIFSVPVSAPGSIPILSDDGKRLAVLNDHCRVYDLETKSGTPIYETVNTGVWGFAPGGSSMLGTAGDGQLKLVDLDRAEIVKTFGAFHAVDEIAISPDARLGAVFDGHSVRIIELDSGEVSMAMDNPPIRGSQHFAWHPNSRYLAIGPYVNQGIELWDVENGVRLNAFEHLGGELRFCFNSTGQRLLTYDAWGNSLQVWNTGSGEVELSRVGLVISAVSADESGGFRLLQRVSGSSLAIVAIDAPAIYHSLPSIYSKHSIPSTNDMAFSADGQLLAVVDHGEMKIFGTRDFQELARLVCGFCYVRFAPDGSLFTSGESGLSRWSLNPDSTMEGEPSNQGLDHPSRLGPPNQLSDSVSSSHIDVSPDGQTIAFPTGSQLEVHFPMRTPEIRILGPHTDVRRVSIRSDGRRVASGGWNGGKARVWDIASGELMKTLDEPDCCLVQFSPNGKWLATSSVNVRLWNAETWAMVAELPVHGSSANGVGICFSPDNLLLAVSDSDACINLFDPATGEKLMVLTDPNQHRAAQMMFNADSSKLAVMSFARAGVHVWDLAALRREIAARNLPWPLDDLQGANPDNNDQADRSVMKSVHPITRLRIVPDQRFVEIDADRQSDLLQKAAEDFEISTARAAIRRIIQLQPRKALTCNNLAWALATGPEPLRDSATAVEFARRALADEKLSDADRALFTNTLGVALYRDGQFEEATRTLEASLAIQPPASQPFDLFFLAMCEFRAGNASQAREYFDRASSLVEQHRSVLNVLWLKELDLFAAEAKQVLEY